MACSSDEVLQALRKGEGEQVEFKRKAPHDLAKEITALANTAGGLILIGVDDDGRPVGTDEEVERIYALAAAITPKPPMKVAEVFLGDKRILCIKVKPSRYLHSWRNVAYIRVGPHSRPLEMHEVLEKAYESGAFLFERMPNPYATVDDLDRALLKEYLALVGLPYSQRSLQKLGFLTKEGAITNAAVLLFSHDPSLFIPEAYVEVVAGEERQQVRGPLEVQWKKAVEMVLAKLRKDFLPAVRGSLSVPAMAVREALLNALLHKNYLSPSPVIAEVSQEGLVVRNPGSFPPGVSVERPVHKARNPLLCEYFLRKGYMEKLGIGIELMRQDAKRHGWHLSIQPGHLHTTVVLRAARSVELSPKEKAVLEAVLQGATRAREVASLVGMSKRSVLRVLGKLVALGLVRREGKGKGTTYHPA